MPEEVYPIDIWREQKRNIGYESIISGNKPPGHSRKQKEGVPKSAKQVLPILIFVGVISWSSVMVGSGSNCFSYCNWWNCIWCWTSTKRNVGELLLRIFLIRKDKVVKEGDRIQLQSGYNGYVHKITPRVTYIRHGLNESLAIIPTRQLVSAEISQFYQRD